MVKAQLNSQDQVNVVNNVVVAVVVVRDVVAQATAFCADYAAKASKGLHLWSKCRAWRMHRAYLMHTGTMTGSIPTPGIKPAGERLCFEGSSSCALGSTGLISRLSLIAS